jgi:hypothetical protein
MVTLLRATIVGINEYKDERYRDKARLHCARADADEIARILALSAAFRVEPQKLHLLTDERATVRAVRESLNTVFTRQASGTNTIALFYFAGHGLHNRKDDLISLCCYDVDFTDPSSQGGLRLNDIYQYLMTSSAECNIAIIDACFSGGIIDQTYISYSTAAEQARRAIEALRGPEGKTVAVFAACRSDQESRESRKHGHGIYTYRLLCGLRDGEACDNDGVVSLWGLARYLAKSFEQDRQVPRTSILSGKEIALWRGTPPVGTISPPPTPRPEAPPGNVLILQDSDIPVHAPEPPPRPLPWRAFAGAGLLVLTVCSLLTVLTSLGHSLFFGLAFGVGIVLSLLVLWPSRGFAFPITLFQLALLAGFGYNHFGWGIGFAPLKWLASFEYLFWIALMIEIVILAIIGLIKFGDTFNNP